MLNKLTIKNVALIDFAEIEFSQGLNVLSGETGSGKSIILESLNFALGAKADKTLIKQGENECFVSAEFSVSNNQTIINLLSEFDVEYDETLILTRKLTLDGKNSIKINGTTVNLTMLKKITSKLVDVHGQSEHYNLLSEINQLKLIDSFGGDVISKIKDEINENYIKYKEIINFLETSGGDERQREIRLDVLNFQISEIENASIYDGEEEELLEIKSKLINQEKILLSLNTSKSCIGEDGGVLDILYNASKSLSSISVINEEYNALHERLESSYAEISDILDEITSKVDNFNTYDVSLDDVLNRLDVIKNLKKKYGQDYNEIQLFLENAIIERNNLLNYEELCASHLKNKEILSKKLYDLYLLLRKEREKVSNEFSKNVLIELKKLGMPNANFLVSFSEFPSITDCSMQKNGVDKIEFMFSANLGESVKPLSFVISGGEMSRFMLAIKVQSSTYSEVSTYIFDEIDAGISGNTANVVAQKLFDISKSVQVIAISHLPQISVYADNNLLIEKRETDGRTKTSVTKLNEDTKINELIRLIGGNEKSSIAYELAKELINNAKLYKSK